MLGEWNEKNQNFWHVCDPEIEVYVCASHQSSRGSKHRNTYSHKSVNQVVTLYGLKCSAYGPGDTCLMVF